MGIREVLRWQPYRLDNDLTLDASIRLPVPRKVGSIVNDLQPDQTNVSKTRRKPLEPKLLKWEGESCNRAILFESSSARHGLWSQLWG